MPLDPDEIRTPPATPEPAPSTTPSAADSSVEAEPEARLIDRLDDRVDEPGGAASSTRRQIPDGPAPHPFHAPIAALIDDGALEPDAGTRNEWMRGVSDYVLELERRRPRSSTKGQVGGAPIQERALDGGLPRALELITGSMDGALDAAAPGYFGGAGGGLFAAGLADLIERVGNRVTLEATAARSSTDPEHDLLEWLGHEFGYDQHARGLLTAGAPMATLTALVSARDHAFGDRGDYSRAIIYTSTQVHPSLVRAARMIGIPAAMLRAVAVDELFRLDVDSLRAQLDADRHRGLRPFCVIASAGTVNTGAIDPLGPLAELCRGEDLWLHVDGSRGGAFVLAPSGRARLRGIEAADSLALDLHSGMSLAHGSGCLLVRDGAQLAAAQICGADEHRRPLRALRLWLPLMLHGARAFRAALEDKLALAQLCAEGLDQRAGAGRGLLEIIARPQLSTVAFRLQRAADEPLERWNHRNLRLLDAINRRGRAYLSSVLLPVVDGDALTLRVCVMGFRTRRAQIDALLADLDEALHGL